EPSRHITELPTLAEPRQRSQGAVLAGDWLAAVAPLMRQLSPSAQTWWAQNLKEAEDHYERWLRATPQQRLQVKASTMAKSFEAGKYCLVEQRGVQLLLKAVPEAFRTDLIATRTLAVNAIVFAILCRWQPGGKLERAQVLDYLVHPEASSSVEETVEGIRKWRRMVLRASELGAVLPDSSLLLKGLDSLTQSGLGDHPVVSFRVAAYRNESSVDFAPTQAKVAELAEYLLAEYEALSIQEDPRAQGPKRQRAAAVKAAAKAEARTGPSMPTPSAKSADSAPKGGKGTKGSGKGGKTKKGEGAAKLQKAQEATSEEAQDATSGAQPTTTADLLKEATEVIRSLKLKALVVRQGRFPPERALEVATEGLEGTGLLDTGASTSMRQARPGELDEGCELRNVNLAVGTVKLFVNPGGTLLSTEDIDPLVSVADLVDMGCQLSWCGHECILNHPERGTIRPSTLNRCPEVPRELALELIGDIEVYRKAQRIVIKALRDEAASLSSQDFAVLQHRLCQAARGDDKVGVLMSAWLSHKFGDLPACLVDSIALQSDRLGAGAASKWNRRVRRACERDGAFVVVGHPRAFKEAARPCVVLDVETKELCEPDTWRYLLKLAVDGKLRGVIGTAPADFNLCDTSLPVESRDDLARGRQTLALMVLLELAACFYEPLVCLGHPSGQPAGIVKFPKVILERQLNRVLCKGKVDLFTNAELPSEALCDVPSFAPEATLWSGCVQEAISVVVRSAVELQTGMLSRAATFRAAGVKADASFRQHLAHDHLPWRRDCRHCVEGGIQSRMHRRIKTPEGFVLSVDLLGKYERGVSEHHPKVVWCLVGCYTVPELSVGPQRDQVTAQDPHQEVSGEAEAQDLPSDVDCEEYAPSLPGEPLLDEDLDGLWAHEEEGPMEWEQAEEDSREFVRAADAELREEEVMSREWADQEKERLRTSKMYELPFVVPLPNKREETVLDGIAFMITQIQALGYCVTRLHSDRGREFCNKRLRSFLRHRGIFKTTSEGDHYQQNGRVEGMINRIKRQARVLMTAASVEHRYWPFALQHVAARMRSRLSPALGGPPSNVLPFGTKVYVRNRRWNRKGQRWAARGLVGTVLAPSVEVTKGHVVLLSDGRLMITTTLLTEVMDPTEPVPSEEGDMQPLHRDLPIDERPVPIISHRIPSKRTVRTVREVSPVLQEEDAEALRLARNPGTSLQELRDHVLGSRWMRTARPRSRGEVFQRRHTHTLGFFRHGGVLGITAECRLFPGFVVLLSRLVKECAPEARWTTLALLVDVDTAVHRDKNNLPGYNNVLVPLCIPKVGGGVWCQAEKGGDQRCLNNGKMIAGELWPLQVLVPFELDPRKFHASQPWSEGSRVVLVAYSLTAIQRAEQNTVWRLRQAGFQLPREAPLEMKQDCDCVEREPTVQVEELGAAAPLEKGCPRVAKLDTNDRADVAVPTPVWRQRFTVLDDAQAERARRQGVRRPRSEWREIRVGPHYGDLNHVRDRPLSAFALSMYLARNRSWEETPLLEVIWGGYENPVPWLFGFQPYGLTERNTQFELDRLGEVHSMVRIGYEDAPNLHGYLFRASFGDEEPKWYFIESMMTLEDRFLSAEAVGRDPIPNPQHHPGHPPRVASLRDRQPHSAKASGVQVQTHSAKASGVQVQTHSAKASGVQAQPHSAKASGVQTQPHSAKASGVQVQTHFAKASGVQEPHSAKASGVQEPHSAKASGVQEPHSAKASGVHLRMIEETSGSVGWSGVSSPEVAGPCAEWAEAERSSGVVPPDKELQTRVWISSNLEASEGNLVWLKCREVLSKASSAAQEEASRYYRSWKSQEPISKTEGVSPHAAWMGLGLVVLDHAARGTINEQCEPLDEFPQELPMSDELAEAVHWASTQVPRSETQGFVEGRVHQGIRRRFGYRPETIGGTLDPSRFPRLYEQGVTPEQFLAMRERVSGLSFIQRIIVTRAVTAGGIVDPPRMSQRGESDFAREVEQAEAERQLARERVAALRAPSGAEPEGDASEEEGRSDDDVVAGDWEDLEGERTEEGTHFFEVPLECSRLHRADTFPLSNQPGVCELVAAAIPLALDEDAREELDRCQLRLQALVKRESNLHVQAVVCDSANGGERAESLRSAAQQVEHATQDLQHSYDEVLQTHVVPNAVVERDPSEWVGPMKEEYEGLQRAVKPLSEAMLEQWRREGTPCEVIPAKVICSIKAPKGRRKVRCVCCGNFARSDRWSRADTYSGGIDAVTLRTLLRFAGLRRLDLGIIDVKQAFLSAPLLSNGVQIVVMTPAMFRRHGICEEKYWSVHQALYGLTISPRSWSVHRDGTLSELRFDIDGAPVRICPMTSDPNIWTVYREEDNSVVVYLALCVDDMLAVGETSHVSQTLDKLCQVWKCTEPALLSETGSVTFNGFEVSSGLDGTLYVHQTRYIQELLQRYEVGEPLQVPCEGQPQTPDEEDLGGFEGRVQKAQQLGGELLWLSTHSRCDLAYSVSVISAWMTKYPTAAIERGIKVLRYLKAYPEVCLKYGTAPNDKGPEGALKVERSESLVEGYSDASFAPESSRSHGAFLTVWAGATVNWCSKKQAYMTMSTCESELGALSDSGQAVISICPLINEFLWGRAKIQPMALLQEQGHLIPRTQVVLYTDNTASVAVVSLPGGTWRTRGRRDNPLLETSEVDAAVFGYEFYEAAAHGTFVRYGDDAMMAFPTEMHGQASSSAGAWLGPMRVPRPTQDPQEEAPSLPLCVTNAGGCFHRMGCSQLVHCTNVSSYEPCARCITDPTLEWVSSQPAMWFWTSRYHVAGCTLRHNGGTRYVPCRHCLPGVRNRRGNRGG
ncbi:unnamed protein product, partial [Symbiodinium necroappetens]